MSKKERPQIKVVVLFLFKILRFVTKDEEMIFAKDGAFVQVKQNDEKSAASVQTYRVQ